MPDFSFRYHVEVDSNVIIKRVDIKLRCDWNDLLGADELIDGGLRKTVLSKGRRHVQTMTDLPAKITARCGRSQVSDVSAAIKSI